MECKTHTEFLPVTEIILDEVQEQDFAQSLVLPDYDPEIFRVICCTADASVTDYKISGGKLSYELRVLIRVIYCSEDSPALHCVSQSNVYSKTADVPEGSERSVYFHIKTDYQNCRATGKRRLDVRGAVSIRIRVSAERMQEIICGIGNDEDSENTGLQIKQRPVTAVSEMKRTTRNITLSEDVDLGSSKPPIEAILRCSARAVQGECSVIAGKLVLRGEIIADMLYRSGGDTEPSVQSMHLSICPYSQIIDLEGIDETYSGTADAQIISFEAKPSGNDMRTLSCTAEVRLICAACKTRSIPIVTDAYSTRAACTCESEELKISAAPVTLSESFTCSAAIGSGENPPEQIYDLHCHMKNVSISSIAEQGKIRVCGMLCSSVLTGNAEGSAAVLEREEAFEELIPVNIRADELLVFASAEPSDCSYHLGADGSLSIKCSVRLCGTAYPITHSAGLTAISLDQEKAPACDRDCALRLYYGTAGEAVWDIAKRCSTKVSAIMEENGITGDVLTKSEMLLIPIVI
ncbi:MAG: SPOCS domain-containing protein [Ruminococcus sp.]